MKTPLIGVVCLARTTFDFEAAAAIYTGIIEDTKKIGGVCWDFTEDLIFEPDQAVAAAKQLAAKGADAVAVISGTFHLGHLALIIHKYVDKPMLLWGLNELPYNGGKIRLNSVCGVNLNASNLYKSGDDRYVCHIGPHIDEDWVNAVKMTAAIRGAKVGLAGYRADGFFNLSVSDTYLFEKTGLLVDHYELKDLFECPEEDRTGIPESDIQDIFDCSQISSDQLTKVSRLSSAMESFFMQKGLDALAVRCWPEFAQSFGISPCAAMSLLNAKGYTVGCEGDIEGTVSMLACNAITEQPAFLADLSQVNIEEDFALMWHCGVAAHTLRDGCSNCSLDPYFAGGKGVTADFVMKSGTITVMRMDSARGQTRLFVASGTAMPMEKELKGTYCKVRFNKPIKEILNTVTSKGIAHHVSLIYGDYADAMKQFARIVGFEVIE